MKRKHSSVLVTGASSGIGRGIALAYAAPGVRIALIGRNADRLETAAALARAKGAEVEVATLDVRDREAMAAWITAADSRHPFDLAVANAGITTGLGPDEFAEDPEAVRAIIATNLIGVLNTIEPLIGPMTARGIGHVAMVGSIAGLHGLPYSPAYCITKAGVHAYAESIRARLERRGVLVSLIVAGYVKTPLNDSIAAFKPGELSEEAAGILIRRRLEQGRATITFPYFLYAAARLGQMIPARWYDRIMLRFVAHVPHTRERV